ncbi:MULTISPECIES: alpha/beta fold hydrolase [Cupriavidus]
MPYADADGAKIYYEETGEGYPILFVHEFGADLRAWEYQVRSLSREYRCIRYNARGYPPSDVPRDDAAYGYRHATDDILAVLRALGIARAHVVGLSMGGYATLNFGLRYPEHASALVVAGCGSGAPYAHREAFKHESIQFAAELLAHGTAGLAKQVGSSPTRIQLKRKSPLAWNEFVRQFSEHSSEGSAYTLRNFQALRPSVFDFERELAACRIPTLLVVGDEDEPAIDTNLFLKRTMACSSLWMVPSTGHAVNLEEPERFNAAVHAFLSRVDRGVWRQRDPRTLSDARLGLSADNDPL